LLKRKERDENLNDMFLAHHREKNMAKIVFKACVRAAKTIQALDERSGIQKHDLWPPLNADEDKLDKEEVEPAENDRGESDHDEGEDVNNRERSGPVLDETGAVGEEEEEEEYNLKTTQRDTHWELNSGHREVPQSSISGAETNPISSDNNNSSNDGEAQSEPIVTYNDWMLMGVSYLRSRLEQSVSYLREQHHYSLLNCCSTDELNEVLDIETEANQILEEYM
jgi:hypothetical protein